MATTKKPDPIISNLTDDSIYFGDSDLWTAATSGDREFLDNYYKGGGKPNQKFNGFGSNHSLLLGAARNNRPEIVELLEGYGEKPLSQEEQDELDEYKYTWNLKKKKAPIPSNLDNGNPKKAFNEGKISQGQADDILIARDNKAKDLLKRYYASEFDLGTLHDQLLKLYDGDIKSAFEWLLANARN